MCWALAGSPRSSTGKVSAVTALTGLQACLLCRAGVQDFGEDAAGATRCAF